MTSYRLQVMGFRNIHLWISVVAVVTAALMYGVAPSYLVPRVFDLRVETADLANIFRVIMCLYLTISAVWIAGILKPEWWHVATVCNLLFMGSISVGRLISIAVDGMPSSVLIYALIAEIILAILPAIQLWRFRQQ